MQLLRGRTTAIEHVSISCDGRFLMAGTTFRHVWDLHEPKAKPRVISAGEPNDCDLDVQFLTATQVFVKTLRTPGWYRHDLETGVTTDLIRPLGLSWEKVHIHPSGGTIKIVGRVQPDVRELSTYRVVGDRLVLLDPPRPLSIWLSGFNPSGTHYLALTQEPPARRSVYGLHDTASDAAVTTFESAGTCLRDARTWCFSSDGRGVFAADRKLLRYDCSTGGQPAHAADWPSVKYAYHPPIAAHPDGRLLATLEDGRAVTFRDADTLEVLRIYDFAMPTVTCVAFTPDGTRCVIGNSRGKVLLFDVD